MPPSEMLSVSITDGNRYFLAFIFFYVQLLEQPIVSLFFSILDHINHIVDVAGIDHVGLGSDFDGVPL